MLTPEQITAVRTAAGASPTLPAEGAPTQSLSDRLGLNKPTSSVDSKSSFFSDPNNLNLTSLTAKGISALGSVMPGQKVGEAIGTLGGYGTTAIGEKMGLMPKGSTENYDTSAPSPMEVGGDIAQGAALVGGLKIPPATSVLGKVAQFGGLSAVSGGGESLAKGEDVKTAAVNAFKSGLTGATVGGAIGLAEKGVNALLDKSPEALYNNALKVTQKLKTAGKSPSEFLKDNGVWGGLGSIQKASEDGMAKENQVIADAVAKLPGGPNLGEITQTAVDNLSEKLGGLYDSAELKAMIDKVPVAGLKAVEGEKTVPWYQADLVRSQLGKLIGDPKWLSSNPSETTQAAQAMYTSLSDAIKQASGTEKNFENLSKWLRTNSVVGRAIDLADSKFGLGLYDVISGTGGAVAGGLTGQGNIGERLKNAAIGGVGGLALERGINSPALKTGVAQLLTHLDSLPTDSAGRIGKTAVTQLIGRFFSGANQSDQQ